MHVIVFSPFCRGENFRPVFKKLGELTCIFDNAAHLTLTATATQNSLKELEKTLNYRNPNIIIANPDRQNIYLEVKRRLPNAKKIDKFDDLIVPINCT